MLSATDRRTAAEEPPPSSSSPAAGREQHDTESDSDDVPELGDSADDEGEGAGETMQQHEQPLIVQAPTSYTNSRIEPRTNNAMQLIARKLHLKFNHTSVRQLIQIAPDHSALEELVDFPLDFKADPCHVCLVTKSKRIKLPRKTPSRAPYPNYRWYLDLTGKMRIRSCRGNQYAGCCVDCHSNDIQPVLCKVKTDLSPEYNRLSRQEGVRPKKLSTDGAGENTAATFETKIANEGTHHEKSAPHWQNQNGRCENAIY
eukprot:1437664-Rhodomonas_salina.1